jgi:hypothetical protein
VVLLLRPARSRQDQVLLIQAFEIFSGEVHPDKATNSLLNPAPVSCLSAVIQLVGFQAAAQFQSR